MCFDLAELRGYHYHSGVVFAAYAGERPEAIARGGRYDEVGAAFGRARPATGFTMDLRDLAGIGDGDLQPMRVLAPYRPADASLQAEVARLRAGGTSSWWICRGTKPVAPSWVASSNWCCAHGAWKLERLV